QQEQLLDWLEIFPAKTVLEMVATPEHGEVLAELGSDSSALSRLTDAALRSRF
ncbi:MAG: hypothetical protein JWM99_1803, partial [Verrucomicrobiales bacterium]|nr:hypothetical protein [Verrucomicrobiales bacterium]